MHFTTKVIFDFIKNFGSNFCTTNFLGVFKSGTEKRLMVFTQKISQDIGSLLYLEKPIMLQNRVTCPSQLFTFFVKKRNPNPISSFVCRNLKKSVPKPTCARSVSRTGESELK